VKTTNEEAPHYVIFSVGRETKSDAHLQQQITLNITPVLRVFCLRYEMKDWSANCTGSIRLIIIHLLCTFSSFLLTSTKGTLELSTALQFLFPRPVASVWPGFMLSS